MKYLIVSVIATSFLMSCQTQPKKANASDSLTTGNHTDTSAQPDDSVKMVTLQNGEHCFAYIKNQDTISMRLDLQGSTVKGSLVYNFYEKDKNKGTFKGSLKGDTLLADYTFSSEGMRSVKQVIFLLKGNILLSGSGSMKEQGKRMVFSNKKDISFDSNLVLNSVNCETLTFK